MIKKTEKAYEVKRAFNNNIVLVDDDEKEIIKVALKEIKKRLKKS